MRPGEIVADRFELERVAGSGAMSIVYRAVDHDTGGKVAVKLLRGADAGDTQRFARETELLAEHLHHPGIVEYVAHGVTGDGEIYLVMEWLEGESLFQRLARGPLSIADAVTLGRRIAEALGAAHRQGIIHRDIKPSNIMLRDGRIDAAKLLDFGIARLGAKSELTLTGVMLGTPGYMPPEQARGQAIDARADVFALGCLLFHCITGRAPFQGTDLLMAVLRGALEDAPRLSEIEPAVPAPLDALVGRMLSRSPDERPTDGAVVAQALASLEVTIGPLSNRTDPGAEQAGLSLRDKREVTEENRTLLGKPTPCVGRDREIAELLAIFDESAGGEGARAALVTADPGVGKSRLRYELLRRLGERGSSVTVLLGRGDPMSAGAPFGMIAPALRRAASVLEDEPIMHRRKKLAARVGRHLAEPDRARVIEFLGELVGTPFEDEDSIKLRAARADPMVMGDQMRMAWEDWLDAESRAQPVMIVLEDLHWGDLPSVQFIDSALRNLGDRRLMVLALARPEVSSLFPDLWAARGLTRMELGNLTRRSSEALVRVVLGDAAPAEVVDRVVTQAAGNAFYLEELVRVVAEGRGEVLPSTVTAMSMARLEILGPEARRVLRAASIFGQVFWEGGAAALLGGAQRPKELEMVLAELVRREVLTPRRTGRFEGEREYVFRHALVREAAYEMLTEEDRALGHSLAAEWLERAGETEALAIAEHFERAGEGRRAVGGYLRAAEQALEGCDYGAVLARADRGIAAGAEGEELGQILLLAAQAHAWRGENAETEIDGLEAMQWLKWGSAAWYTAIAETAAAGARQGHHERLVELAAVLRDAVLAGERSAPLWIAASRAAVHLYQIGRDDLGDGMLDLLLSATYAGTEREPEVRARLHTACAKRAQQEGDPAGYMEQRRAAVAELDAAGDVRNACIERINVGYALLKSGAYQEAEQALRSALATAERLDLRAGRASAHQNLGFVLSHLGAQEEALRIERQAVAQFTAQGDRRMAGGSRIYLSAILQRSGELADAEREAREAAQLLEAAPPLRPYALAMLARALLGQGRVAEALDAVRAATDLASSLGRIEEGEANVLLVHAEILDALGDRAAASAVLGVAHERLNAQAAKLRDPALRESFLQNIPEHRRTLELAKAWATTPGA